jgi:hypothetical protein
MICSYHKSNVENIVKMYLVIYLLSSFTMMGFTIIALTLLF